jgi:nucleotide-binding universal stress UspA family protein
MRTLVGVSGDGQFSAALSLLAKLRFSDNHLTLAHVGTTFEPPIGPFPGMVGVYDSSEVDAALRDAGQQLLARASQAAARAGLAPDLETVYDVGSSSTVLMRLADQNNADLVAIGSRQQGAVESIFLGSVGRALAIGAHQSFLVVRRDINEQRPLRAVFATDHSEYADRCFDRLLQMNPEGLTHLTVMTALETRLDSPLSAEDDTDGSALAASLTEAETSLRERGQEMVDQVTATGRTGEFRLVEGFPIDAIRQTMGETQADLLILGARGHGLIERIFIGSLALHAVVAEPFSVLVVRLPQDQLSSH